MRILVTGSSGHLGEALVRVLGSEGHDVIGLDVLDSPHTSVVGSVTDRDCVRRCVDGVDSILHLAALHKPPHRLPRAVDLEDIVNAHRRALTRAPEIGFRSIHHQCHHPVHPR